MNEVNRHELANSLVATPWSEIEHKVCEDLVAVGSNACHEEIQGIAGTIRRSLEKAKESIRINITAAQQGLTTLAAWIKKGGYVDQETAESRALICASCPNNVHVTCPTCAAGRIAMTIMNVRRGRQTRMDSVLKHCSACGCSLLVKVWVPVDVIREHMPADQFSKLASNCWIKP